MPRELLLLLTFGFCIFAYTREVRRVAVSPAIWIVTLWMLRCGSRGIDAWVGGGGTLEEGTNWDQVYILLIALAGFVAVFARGRRVSDVLRQNPAIVLMFAYMTVSVTWSEVGVDSAKRLFRAYGDLAMVLLVASEARPFEAMKVLVRRIMIILIPLSLVLAKYYPDIGRWPEKNWAQDTWIGVATHKNTLGPLCFLAAYYCLVMLLETRRRRPSWLQTIRAMPLETAYLGMSIYLLNGNGQDRSVTSILTFCLAVFLYVFFERFRRTPKKILPFLIIVCVSITVIQLGATLLLDRSLLNMASDLRGKEEYLSGRGELWPEVIKEANKHPWIGAGYGGFWSPRVLTMMHSMFSWGPAQSHNGYVETYAQLGIIGLILLALVILSAVRGAIRACFYNFDFGRWRIVLLLCALVHNIAEAGIPRPTHFVWFTFLLVAINSASRMAGSSRKQRAHRAIGEKSTSVPVVTGAMNSLGRWARLVRAPGCSIHLPPTVV